MHAGVLSRLFDSRFGLFELLGRFERVRKLLNRLSREFEFVQRVLVLLYGGGEFFPLLAARPQTKLSPGPLGVVASGRFLT
jgi:hypothetical protein